MTPIPEKLLYMKEEGKITDTIQLAVEWPLKEQPNRVSILTSLYRQTAAGARDWHEGLTRLIDSFLIEPTVVFKLVGPQTMSKYIIPYLLHYKGVPPPPLPCPVRSTNMAQIVTDRFQLEMIEKCGDNKKEVFEIILAANALSIKPLLHLGCTKIATEIKKLDQSEINAIIEEEERYRREHGGDGGGA